MTDYLSEIRRLELNAPATLRLAASIEYLGRFSGVFSEKNTQIMDPLCTMKATIADRSDDYAEKEAF